MPHHCNNDHRDETRRRVDPPAPAAHLHHHRNDDEDDDNTDEMMVRQPSATPPPPDVARPAGVGSDATSPRQASTPPPPSVRNDRDVKRAQAAEKRKAQAAAQAERRAQEAAQYRRALDFIARYDLAAANPMACVILFERLSPQRDAYDACITAALQDATFDSRAVLKREPGDTFLCESLSVTRGGGSAPSCQLVVNWQAFPTKDTLVRIDTADVPLRHSLNHILKSSAVETLQAPDLLRRVATVARHLPHFTVNEWDGLSMTPNAVAESVWTDGALSPLLHRLWPEKWHQEQRIVIMAEESERNWVLHSETDERNCLLKTGYPTSTPAVTSDRELQEKLLQRLSNSTSAEFFSFANHPNLGFLPPHIILLTHLQQLDLSNCGLSDLPSLGAMPLRKLFLQKNRFKRIPDSVLTVHMRELRVLDMSHNELEVVPVEFGLLSALEVVQLDYNRIRRIECDFSRMPRLEAIDLVDNELRSLPATVGSLERLWRLKISANPLTQIPPEVYHRGVGAIKKFFSEMSPQNLAVPASRLVEELNAWAVRDGSCDAVLVGRGGCRVRTLAAVVQARLPGLFKDAASRVRATRADADDVSTSGGDSDAVLLVDLEDMVDEVALQALHALLLGNNAGIADAVPPLNDAGTTVELAKVVVQWGSAGLRTQLQRLERGHALDVNAVVAADLELLWTSGAAPRGRVARFAVGDGVEVAVHRELLCARSEYFARMLRGGLAESAMAVVPLEGVDADVFRAFAAYVYSDNTSKMTPGNVVSLLFLAVEYDCARLKAMAECVVGLNVEVENVAQVLQVAHYLGAERLRQTCCFFAATHLSAVKRTAGWAEVQNDVKEKISSITL